MNDYSDLYMQHRQPQPLPCGFALEHLRLSSGRIATLPFVLGLELRQQARTVLDCMLAVLLGQTVHACVDLCHLLDLCHIIKKGELDLRLRRQAGKNNAGLPVERPGPVHMTKALAEWSEKLDRIGGRPAQLQFHTAVREILLPQEYHEPCGRELITPRLDAGVLKVF